MNKRFFALATLASTLSASIPGALAQQDGPPVDANAILNSLSQLGEKNGSSSQQQFQAVLQEFTQASASGPHAVELYEKAVRATSYAGRPQQQTEFQEWKKKQGEKLRGQEVQAATQFHLEYLVLSLKYAGGTSIEQLLPELLAHTQRVFAAKPEVFKQELARHNITDSVFTRWKGLGYLFNGLKGWEFVPTAADGIWEKSILPELRKKKDPQIIRYWDERLRREAEAAGENRLEFDANRFDLITRPTLQWRRAEDLVVLNMRNNAIKEMLGLIKDYPNHPENASWITKLRNLLEPEKPKATAAE